MNAAEVKAMKAKLRKEIASLPKCPTCGGFAIPSTEGGLMVCKDHGRFQS